MFTELLKSALLKVEDDSIKELQLKIRKGENLTETDFINLAEAIDGDVREILKTEESLKYEIRYKEPSAGLPARYRSLISAKTLFRHFKEGNYKLRKRGHKAYQKTIHLLLIYAGVKKENWINYLEEPQKYEFKTERLLGLWFLYRFDYKQSQPKLKRTHLKITPGNGKSIDAQFVSLSAFYRNGTAKITNSKLSLNFENEYKSIEMTIYISEDILNDPRPHLNVIIRSVGDWPYAKNAIMVKQGDRHAEINTRLVEIVGHSSRHEGVQVWGAGTDPIYEYLARKAKGLKSRPFSPANLDNIISRNKHFFLKTEAAYQKLKDILSARWYSVSAIPSLKEVVPVNSYTFHFNDVLKECTFTCHRADIRTGKITGRVEYSQDQVILNSTPGELNGLFSLGLHENDRLYACTTWTEDRRHFITREVFFSADRQDLVKNEEGKAAGKTVSYENFIKSTFISNYEKSCLFAKEPDFTNWPPHPGLSGDYDLLENLAGTYLAYIPNAYADDDSLLQITLEIDQLGFVTETVYTETGTAHHTAIYQGRATILNNTLRLSNKTGKDRKSDYIFRIRRDDTTMFEYFEGLTTDKDEFGYPCADATLVIRYHKNLKLPFIAKILRKDKNEYDLLDQYVRDNFETTIHDFFFVHYPSIRRKMNKKRL